MTHLEVLPPLMYKSVRQTAGRQHRNVPERGNFSDVREHVVTDRPQEHIHFLRHEELEPSQQADLVCTLGVLVPELQCHAGSDLSISEHAQGVVDGRDDDLLPEEKPVVERENDSHLKHRHVG